MDKITNLNVQRVLWCMEEEGLDIEALAKNIKIPKDTLCEVLQENSGITFKQLEKLALFFNRGLLFFLEESQINENTAHTLKFRTLTSQKPMLPIKMKHLIERAEKHREKYIALLEENGEVANSDWYSENIRYLNDDIEKYALTIRKWLDIDTPLNFQLLRNKIEKKGIIVLVSNGYAGKWQVPKESNIKGFSLYFEKYPVIFVTKQQQEEMQAFTLVHELAHLLIHQDSSIDDKDDIYSYRGAEKVANEFAANFLAPESLLQQIDMANFPFDRVDDYGNYLKGFKSNWCVSIEVIIRRLVDTNKLDKKYYSSYRNWLQELENRPIEQNSGGQRIRYKEPLRIYGEQFVKNVLDALHSERITSVKASRFLDDIKISYLSQLDKFVRI